MPQTITVTTENILAQVKLSGKIPEIVEQVVARQFITDAAAEAGIEIEIEELQKAADQIRLANKLNSANDTWVWLEKYSLSLKEFEEMVYNKLISTKLATHLFADKTASYFFENQLDYAGVVMYEVILDDEEFALELYYAIKEHEISFYDVAHKYIQDIQLRRSGGYRGIVHRQELKPEISASIFAAKPPQVLKPILSSSGVHLILVEEIIQPKLDEKLRSQIISNLFGAWVKEEIAKIEVLSTWTIVA